MAAIKNPYGVGDSGELLTDCKNRCACCKGWFVFRGHPRMRERWPKRCPHCERHRLDGSAQDVIVALTEHAERFRDLADRAYAMTTEAKAVASKIDERNKYLNNELRDARDERSSLREQLNELRALHTYGRAGTKCGCGRQHCQERQILYGEA